MKFQLFVLPTIPGILEDGERLRPIARNNDRFQEMLEQVRQICILGDELGFDCFSTTEHHFHSEGYECSVAPLVLYSNLAAQTRGSSSARWGSCSRPGIRSGAQKRSLCWTTSPRVG